MAVPQLQEINVTEISGLVSYPLTGDYYFWASILFAIFTILTLAPYFKEKFDVGKSNFFSHLAVSSIVTIVLSFLGTLFGMITNDIMITVLVLGSIFISLWYFQRD